MHTYKQSSLTPNLATLFMLPLSQQAYNKLQNLQRQLLMVPFDTQAIDQWSSIWGNQVYTSSKLYNLFFVMSKSLILTDGSGNQNMFQELNYLPHLCLWTD